MFLRTFTFCHRPKDFIIDNFYLYPKGKNGIRPELYAYSKEIIVAYREKFGVVVFSRIIQFENRTYRLGKFVKMSL